MLIVVMLEFLKIKSQSLNIIFFLVEELSFDIAGNKKQF